MDWPYCCTIAAAGLLLVFIIRTWRYSDLLIAKQLEVSFFFSVFVGLVGTTTWLYSPSQIPWRLLAKPSVEATRSENHLFSKELAGDQTASEPLISGPAVTYAAPQGGIVDNVLSSTGLSGLDRWTAIYDISAHTVYLPSGAALEAHSGLGPKLDDPRYVHERMRGATPPHVYELGLREKAFHGTRALRLNPIGGNEHIFGRSGLLAHRYMLGSKGYSNGCVVFKDYAAFLNAFESGEVKRLLVVAHID
jgi:Tlde1 domain